MFTPIHTTLGATLLGKSSFGLLLHNGQVFGISSLLSGSFLRPSWDNIPIIAGLISSLAPVYWRVPSLLPFYPAEPTSWKAALATLGVGLLIGWGTKNDNGCTSGHMLCGISRLSPRSFLATAIFFITAMLTANFVPGPEGRSRIPPCENGMPCYTTVYPTASELRFMLISNVLALVTNFFLVPRLLKQSKKSRALFSYIAGFEFGLGLLLSGMASPQKVQQFFAILTKPSRFDPSLALIILFGILPSMCSYLVIKPGKQPAEKADPAASNAESGSPAGGEIKPPTLAQDWSIPNRTIADVDWRFVAGAVAFGVGWGLSGVCPGPAILRAVLQPRWGASWIAGYLLGNVV